MKQMIQSFIAEYLVEGYVLASISAFTQNTGAYLFPIQIWEQIKESLLVNPKRQLYMALGDITSSMTDQQTEDAKDLFHEIMQEVRYKFSPIAGDGVARWLSTQHINFAPGTVIGEKDGFKGYAKFLYQTDEYGSSPDFYQLPLLLLVPDPYVPPYIRFGKNLKQTTVLTGKNLTAYRKLLKEAIHNYVDRYLALPESALARKLRKRLSPFAKVRGVEGRELGFGTGLGGDRYEQIKPPLGMSREQYFSREGQIRIMKSAPIKTIRSALKLPPKGMVRELFEGSLPFINMKDPRRRLKSFIPAMAIGNILLNDQKEYAKKVLKDKLGKESTK